MNIILATSNSHKHKEISKIFSDFCKFQNLDSANFKVWLFSDFVTPFEIVENGNSFEQNAQIKALAVKNALLDSQKFLDSEISKNFAVLSEDSGLCIDALGGIPGIYSARFSESKDFENLDSENWQTCEIFQNLKAQNALTDELNLQRVIFELQRCELSESGAHFEANMCLILDSKIHHFSGQIKGRAITQKLGANGFGYDPIFIPNGYEKTMAQIENKNDISHRKIALCKVLEFLTQSQLVKK